MDGAGDKRRTEGDIEPDGDMDMPPLVPNGAGDIEDDNLLEAVDNFKTKMDELRESVALLSTEINEGLPCRKVEKESVGTKSERISSSSSDSDYSDVYDSVDELQLAENEDCIESSDPCLVQQTSLRCFICDFTDVTPSSTALLDHFKEDHNVDLQNWVSRFRMGPLQLIRCANYFESVKARAKADNVTEEDACKEVVLGLASQTITPWRQDEVFLRGTRQDVLSYCRVLDLIDSEDDEELAGAMKTAPNSGDHTECQLIVRQMRGVMHRILEDVKVNNNHSTRESDDSSGYFESYDDADIHATMINDFPRTNAYRKILVEQGICKGRSVLDVGCGTGILSLFAAEGGATRVVAVDRSEIIIETIDIIHENKLQNVIECKKGTVETLNLENADIIVSEWMGYFLLFEGMLNSFLFARDNCLNPGGSLVPSSATISIAGISDLDLYKTQLGMWDNVYGYKMSAMRRKVERQAQIVLVNPQNVVTNSDEILNLDLYTCTADDAVINHAFELKITRTCELTGVVGHFDTFLVGPQEVVKLGTAPSDPPTHWKQCVFQLPEKLLVKEGQVLKGNIKCAPSRENKRWLEVEIKFEEPKFRFTYTLN